MVKVNDSYNYCFLTKDHVLIEYIRWDNARWLTLSDPRKHSTTIVRQFVSGLQLFNAFVEPDGSRMWGASKIIDAP